MKLSVPLLAIAFTVPVRVKVQLTVLEVVVGLLQVGVIPAGRPEAIATLAPAAFDGIVTPPCAVSVTTNEVLPMEDMVKDWCDNVSLVPGLVAHELAVMPKHKTNK